MSIKISNRPEELNPQGEDLLAIISDPSGARIDKKVTLDTLGAAIGGVGPAGPQGPEGPAGPAGAGSPAGIDTQLQLNNAGAFGGANLFNRDFTNSQAVPSTMIDIVEPGKQQALKLWLHSDAVPVPANGEFFRIEFEGDSSDLIGATPFHYLRMAMSGIGTGLSKAIEDRPYLWIDGQYGGLRLTGPEDNAGNGFSHPPEISLLEMFSAFDGKVENQSIGVFKSKSSEGIGLHSSGKHLLLGINDQLNLNGLNYGRDTFYMTAGGLRTCWDASLAPPSDDFGERVGWYFEYKDAGDGDPGYTALKFKIWEDSSTVSYYGPGGVLDLAHEKYIIDAAIEGPRPGNPFAEGRRFAVTSMGAIKMRENDESGIAEPGIGQIWVKNTTPNQLWFTDDTGVDTQLTVGGGGGGGGAFTADVDTRITPTTPVLLNNASGDEVAFHFAYTLNKAGGTSDGLIVDATTTSSDGNHKFIEVKNDGVSIFSVESQTQGIRIEKNIILTTGERIIDRDQSDIIRIGGTTWSSDAYLEVTPEYTKTRNGKPFQITDDDESNIKNIWCSAVGGHVSIFPPHVIGSTLISGAGIEVYGSMNGGPYDFTEYNKVRFGNLAGGGCGIETFTDGVGPDFGRGPIVLKSHSETVKIDSSMFLVERAAALTSIAGQGQLWVKNTTPCQLWFTDDAGTSTQIV